MLRLTFTITQMKGIFAKGNPPKGDKRISLLLFRYPLIVVGVFLFVYQLFMMLLLRFVAERHQ